MGKKMNPAKQLVSSGVKSMCVCVLAFFRMKIFKTKLKFYAFAAHSHAHTQKHRAQGYTGYSHANMWSTPLVITQLAHTHLRN